MGYPARKLNPDESIALDLHPHWWFFAKQALALALVCVLGGFVLYNTDDGGTLSNVSRGIVIVLLGAAALWLLARYTKWITTHFVITSHRLIFRQGVIAKRGIEIPLERVNNVNFNQSIFERMLGAGDLLIESGGQDGQQRFTDIRHPDEVQNLIHRQMEKLAERRGGYRAAPQHSLDVAEQLERLEGMLERGTLTEEEFESQKRRLLDLD